VSNYRRTGEIRRTINGEPTKVQGLMIEATRSAALRQAFTRFTQHARLAQGVVLVAA
jgi:hypothetical protein